MPPVMIFDGTCSFCSRGVDFVLRHDRRERLVFAARQSPAGQEILQRFEVPKEGGSVYLVEGDRLYARSGAVLRIARHLGFPWNLAYAFILVPRALRDPVYDWMARNRHRWAGKAAACRLPEERDRRRFLGGDAR